MPGGAEEKIRRKMAALYLLCENYAKQMEAQAKSTASWVDRTSHARQSIHSGVTQKGSQTILYLSHGVRYGQYLEEGTPPHIIEPKEKKALFWYGAKHPVKRVNHPGTEPQPVIGSTVDLYWPVIRDARRRLFRED